VCGCGDWVLVNQLVIDVQGGGGTQIAERKIYATTGEEAKLSQHSLPPNDQVFTRAAAFRHHVFAFAS